MQDADWLFVWNTVTGRPSLLWTTIVPALVLVGLIGWWLKHYFTGRTLAGVRADSTAVRGELAGVRQENAVLRERLTFHEEVRQWTEAQKNQLADQLREATEQLSAAHTTLLKTSADKQDFEDIARLALGNLFTANTEVQGVRSRLLSSIELDHWVQDKSPTPLQRVLNIEPTEPKKPPTDKY